MSTNLYALDVDPVACAKAYCDLDVMQMPYEYVQILHEAHYQLNGGAARQRHVLIKWAMGSAAFTWLARLTRELLAEQLYRFEEYDDEAASELDYIVHPDNVLNWTVPRFVQLLPHKIPGDAITAYRDWYQTEADPIWTKRGAPEWWQGSEQYSLRF